MQKPVYKRELSHSYLVIKDVPENKMSKYQYRMLIRNRIAGLLTCSERFIDGKTCLYYDISSRQSLAQIYEAGTGTDSYVGISAGGIQSDTGAGIYFYGSGNRAAFLFILSVG